MTDMQDLSPAAHTSEPSGPALCSASVDEIKAFVSESKHAIASAQVASGRLRLMGNLQGLYEVTLNGNVICSTFSIDESVSAYNKELAL